MHFGNQGKIAGADIEYCESLIIDTVTVHVYLQREGSRGGGGGGGGDATCLFEIGWDMMVSTLVG